MNPLTLYARKTPFGVAIFRDGDALNPTCTFTRNACAKLPDRRNKWVMFNCYRWRLVWLPDTAPPTNPKKSLA